MMDIKGKYAKALIMTEDVDQRSREQIQRLCDSPSSKGAQLRFMADVHAGVGCTIGTTIRNWNVIIPNLVGVDIGCGVLACCLGEDEPNYQKLDDFIIENIPIGFLKRKDISKYFEHIKGMRELCEKIGADYDTMARYIGTLGGGNHFIEVDRDTLGRFWVVIHSGSRGFGWRVANYHQEKAVELAEKYYIREEYRDIEFLADKNDQTEYIQDTFIAQDFARVNRRAIANEILHFLGAEFPTNAVESVHNYIGEDYIVRKGAISCYPSENVVIPLNMASGTIFGKGKDDDKLLLKWNYSAPHGAGRSRSRREMKRMLKDGVISMDGFREKMNGVWSSTVSEDTIDESPFAYKPSEDIIEKISEIVDIDFVATPTYNFKAE